MSDQYLCLYTTVLWEVPPHLTTDYDTVNIYRSTNESKGYVKIASQLITITSYIDKSIDIGNKDGYYYTVTFSSSTGSVQDTNYFLAHKALTPREQRMIFQLRDSLSRFISDRLADEEIRQYLQQGLQSLNVFSPTTAFTMVSLPNNLEQLVLIGSLIWGVTNNLLGIGFTDINYSDNGWSLTTNRMDKMNSTLDKILKIYADSVKMAKMDYAPSASINVTVPLPMATGGRMGNIMGMMDLLGALGR